MNSYENIKCVSLGDGAVGKTCLLVSYSQNKYPEEYIPTVFDNYNATVQFNDTPIALALWDTAGQEDYDRLRPLSYPETDIFLVLFSLIDRTSLENVTTKWIPEIKEFSPHTPYFLVGTKLDLREDLSIQRELKEKYDDHPVTKYEGEKVANSIKACGYYEVSAKTQKGLKELFTAVVKRVMDEKNKVMEKSSLCFPSLKKKVY